MASNEKTIVLVAKTLVVFPLPMSIKETIEAGKNADYRNLSGDNTDIEGVTLIANDENGSLYAIALDVDPGDRQEIKGLIAELQQEIPWLEEMEITFS